MDELKALLAQLALESHMEKVCLRKGYTPFPPRPVEWWAEPAGPVVEAERAQERRVVAWQWALEIKAWKAANGIEGSVVASMELPAGA